MNTKLSKKEINKEIKTILEDADHQNLNNQVRLARLYSIISHEKQASQHFLKAARFYALTDQTEKAKELVVEALSNNPKHQELQKYLQQLEELLAGELQNITKRVLLKKEITKNLIYEADEVGAVFIEQEEQIFEVGDISGLHSHFKEENSSLTMTEREEQIKECFQLLSQTPVFSGLSYQHKQYLAEHAFKKEAQINTHIFEEHEIAESCILVANGYCLVNKETDFPKKNIDLLHLSKGDVAGLLSLFHQKNRQATLIAQSYVNYFEINNQFVSDILQKSASARFTFQTFLQERHLISLLAKLPICRHHSLEQRQALLNLFQIRNFEKGDELFYQEDERDGLWIIFEGDCHLHHDKEGILFRLKTAEFIGLLANSLKSSSPLSCIASRSVKTGFLSQKKLQEIIQQQKQDNESLDLKKLFQHYKDKQHVFGDCIFLDKL